MCWVNTMVLQLNFIEPTPKVRALFQHTYTNDANDDISLDKLRQILKRMNLRSSDNYYCCACSKTSISIYKYMQKAGEPENDAGFLKHNYRQLNCSCYSYPSKPRLQWLQIFRLHIYGISRYSC